VENTRWIAYLFLLRPTTKSRRAAPATALTKEPISPPGGNAEHPEQPAPDDRADDAHNHIARQPEAAAANQQAGKPARQGADEEKDNDTL
jgi:hypothetical protein